MEGTRRGRASARKMFKSSAWSGQRNGYMVRKKSVRGMG
jgi:hypothetical protein